MKLTHNTILITGGATGIGLALARRFSADGNQVIICSRNASSLAQAKAEVPALITRICDVADPNSRNALTQWLQDEHPTLNAIVNNAGIQVHRDFTAAPAMDTLDQEVAINFTAPIHLISHLLPLLQRQTNAYIVNVSSGLAFSPMADVPVYCATKAAIHSFTLSLRHQLRDTNIRVIEIAPPIVDTGLGGNTRSGGVSNNMMVSAEDFVDEAFAQLEQNKDEVLVGISARTRELGEAMFDRMNNRA
ncbi:SDR family oxidoreductase [Xanthomonas sp. WHRI 8391]|uniref:Putative oxidoreductase EphD n=1 Tax=Xanthomonas hortorum pv. carotae TaxID=487904 RepID=A0A6V7C131_9XANT|nr:SDR family oxidoreductase [Xanthomonas hortorum]MBG3850528.1 SDR family oxidoreductase [Xanthomonas hortorum pv. carotae]CAD0307577.1 putative oxidoreductase EphD [Xanthomonas hortorum pv. carotae]CAD0307584.1 putative oxidoreductase EphD [Xanthomonas hortorum pv. carotae]